MLLHKKSFDFIPYVYCVLFSRTQEKYMNELSFFCFMSKLKISYKFMKTSFRMLHIHFKTKSKIDFVELVSNEIHKSVTKHVLCNTGEI